MKKCIQYISIAMLLFAVGFNFWLYREEPSAKIDPNDNAFQYALVERTYEIWDWASDRCQESSVIKNIPLISSLTRDTCIMTHLVDHWVPNWAQGYNLPYYYSHVPQILIVGSYKLVSSVMIQVSRIFPSMKLITWNGTLFSYYHFVIYVLLCLFPLAMFLSFRILKLPFLTAGIGAIFASHISTDGMYGLDQTSYLWRGWGLSSQLFAAVFLPIALAFLLRFNEERKNNSQRTILSPSCLLSILFITATTMGHLGIGMLLFLSLPVIAMTEPLISFFSMQPVRVILGETKQAVFETILLAIPPIVLLSYWIIPAVLGDRFHNVSFWDPVWKFNSYGAKEVLTNLFNGNLFDFGRFPVFTILVGIGFFYTLGNKTLKNLLPLPFLFLFFLFLYFGRTTFGSLLDGIPGLAEYHQHRFIVGVQLIGLFLAPIGFTWIIDKISKIFRLKNASSPAYIIVFLVFSVLICFSLYPQTISYAEYNSELIQLSNEKYEKEEGSVHELFSTLKTLPPGRIFAGRGGGWGRNFKIADTTYYMHLSTYGLPTVMWLPQTWSLNSDIEQYFSESNPIHYNVFGIRYVVAPPEEKAQSFWKLIKETKSWKLYEVEQQDTQSTIDDPKSTRYMSTGVSPSVVYSGKLSFGNLIRLWLHSPYPSQGIFPQLVIQNNPSAIDPSQSNIPFPHFSMTSEASYITPDNKTHSLMAEPPIYISPFTDINQNISNNKQSIDSKPPITVISSSSDTDMVFKATVEVKDTCPTCVVVLKQTYHPNWKATVNGKPVETISVFPFHTAIRLEEAGVYEIAFRYEPSPAKNVLLFLALVSIVIWGFWKRKKEKDKIKKT